MSQDFRPGEAARVREAYTRSVRVPGMVLRRVLGFGAALFWPDRLGDGTLTPEVVRELERLERQGLGYLAERAEFRTVANQRIIGPPAALEYAADQFEGGSWAPAGIPSGVPTLSAPAPLEPSQETALPFVPGDPAPRRSDTDWSDVPNPRESAVARRAEEAARDRLRRQARHRAVVRETNARMAELAERLEARLAEARSVSSRVFEEAHQREIARNEAAAIYEHLEDQARSDYRDAVARYEAELERLEREHDEAAREADELERSERSSTRRARVQRQADLERKAERERQVATAVKVQFFELDGFPEPTVQRFGFDGGGAGTGAKVSEFQRRQSDRKTGSRQYRFGLMLISRSYGRIDEGLDLLIALADNVYYADELADGVPHGDRFLQGQRSTPLYYKDIVAGLLAGDLELDVMGFAADYTAMRFEDWLFGQAGHASRELSQYMGRPVGVMAGPAL